MFILLIIWWGVRSQINKREKENHALVDHNCTIKTQNGQRWNFDKVEIHKIMNLWYTEL